MATNGDQSTPIQNTQRGGWWLLLLLLGGALAALCHEAFLPHRVHWSNDQPLGSLLDSSYQLPDVLLGHWSNLEWLGGSFPSSSPSISTLLLTFVGPHMFLKILLPFSMFLLGLGAWFFFRQSGFARPVCIVGALGAGLNMHYFSNGSWGLGTWAISAAMVFVALGIIVSPSIRPLWVKGALAGLAIGMIVMEGFDSGAIMTLYVGIFIIFYFLTTAPAVGKGIPKVLGVEALAVIFALLISSSTLYTLVGTQILGTGAEQNEAGKTDESALSAKWAFLKRLCGVDLGKAQWDFTTTFSLPKLETTRLFIPGLFGYRLQEYMTDTNKASAYWGKVGEDPHIDELESSDPQTRARSAASLGIQPEIQNVLAGDDLAAREQIMDQIRGFLQRRHTGSGDYTGVLVCLLALFGLFNSWRKINGPYSANERKFVWFWGIAALISLMAAWGRYSWLYQFIYHLPFINYFRNPIKFLHPLNICLIILSGYGLEALYRRYISGAAARAPNPPQSTTSWWQKADGFDKKWTIGTLLVLVASVIALLILSSSKGDLVRHLEHTGFSAELAPQIASFTVKEFVLYIVFFSASAGIVISVLSGIWTGRRAVWAWVFLGAIMILDLGHADLPWLRYYDYTKVYNMNPVVDFLRHQPWEHRVMSRLSPTGGYIPGEGNFVALCHWWLENDYMANNIESLEIDQAPRLPIIDGNMIGLFRPRSQEDWVSPLRLFRLTNTRYIFADARWTPIFNQVPEFKDSFRNVMLVDILPKREGEPIHDAGDLTVKTNDNGHIALIEFTKALPRAKLYANWQMADDAAALAKLNAPEFDPATTVLVATNTPIPQPAQAGADPGTVTITSYESKDVKLTANAKTPAVLLLNDRSADYWKVWVDQQPASILRCNYIMRGVFLPQGQHTIEFRFQPPLRWLYVSTSAFAVGLLLIGFVVFTQLTRRPAPVPAAGGKSSANQNRKAA